MAQKIGIWYFSGTGVTKTVAAFIADGFRQRGCTVDLKAIEDALMEKKKIATDRYDLIGFGAPVIGFGTPKIMNDFLKLVPKSDMKKTFIFRSAGGVAPINYNASKSLIAKLRRKGCDVFHERLFSIASNWLVRFDAQAVKKLYAATAEKAARMCGEILDGKTRTLETGRPLRFLIAVSRIFIPPLMRITGKSLRADSNCTLCASCVKSCPGGNISIKNGKVRFGFSCSCCMRCVYQCPHSAISFAMAPSFRLADGFNLNSILAQPADSTNSSADRIPPFLAEYIANPDM